MLRIHALQHVPFEGLGHIGQWITRHGHQLTMTKWFDDPLLPDMCDFDRLIIMGGPMNIYEDAQYPWLAKERKFIKEVIDCGKSAVGICLGAQLLADALGSPVFAGMEKEIGWFPVTLTDAGKNTPLLHDVSQEQLVFHWHGDTFDPPAGAIHLAESKGCRSQAFLYDNRILGLQFHLESTPETVHALLHHCKNELLPGRYIQSEADITAASATTYSRINQLMEKVLDRLP